LDIIRLLSALFVLLTHTNERWLIAEKLPFWDGHAAVIVFFVLSGFVIAFVTSTKEKTLEAYAASRVARLYSLSLIAIVLTPILDEVGRSLWPMIYEQSPHDHVLVRMLTSGLFAGEAWWQSMMTFSDQPFWSLNYEAWYYAAFGIILFAPARIRAALLILGALALGPKVLLLAPCWAVGVWLYRTPVFNRLSAGMAAGMFLLALAAIVLYRDWHLEQAFATGLRPIAGAYLFERLSWASFFGADWLLAALVALNFGAARRLSSFMPAVGKGITKALRYLGNLTFPLYIFHYPLLLLWGAVLRGDPMKPWFYCATLALTLASCVLLGAVGEKLRPVIQRATFALVVYVKRRRAVSLAQRAVRVG